MFLGIEIFKVPSSKLYFILTLQIVVTSPAIGYSLFNLETKNKNSINPENPV